MTERERVQVGPPSENGDVSDSRPTVLAVSIDTSRDSGIFYSVMTDHDEAQRRNESCYYGIRRVPDSGDYRRYEIQFSDNTWMLVYQDDLARTEEPFPETVTRGSRGHLTSVP